ncbi:MAG: hypothetical protein K6G90_01060 [Clostridia bacterium]|nr:hypothetical protein [Clostridia bacterium]
MTRKSTPSVGFADSSLREGAFSKPTSARGVALAPGGVSGMTVFAIGMTYYQQSQQQLWTRISVETI